MSTTRREMLCGAAAVMASAAMRSQLAAQIRKLAVSCPFHLAVINDEISPDLDHAAQVAANDFGLHWIEVRAVAGKVVTSMSADELAGVKTILDKYQLKVTDIASPLFKSDFPGAPMSKDSPNRNHPEKVPTSFDDQGALLDRCINAAKALGTDRVRCFDFWRLEDPAPYREAINHKLDEAATKCANQGIVLVLENEMACNTGSGTEALALLRAIPNKNLMLNWDPGNSATFPGDVPYPDDYKQLPKDRIGHVHVKNVRRDASLRNGWEWQPVDQGVIDWAGQFAALKRNGYSHAVSLETHWRGGGTLEASTRRSMQGLMDCMSKAGLAAA